MITDQEYRHEKAQSQDTGFTFLECYVENQ